MELVFPLHIVNLNVNIKYFKNLNKYLKFLDAIIKDDNYLTNINICATSCIPNKIPDRNNLCQYCDFTCETN